VNGTGQRALGRASRGAPILLGALVVDSIGNGLFLSLTLVFFIELTDVPLGVLGLLCSLANGLALPVPILAGSLTDRWGALPLVIAALVLGIVNLLAISVMRWLEKRLPQSALIQSALIQSALIQRALALASTPGRADAG
jgi:hypothetical protein